MFSSALRKIPALVVAVAVSAPAPAALPASKSRTEPGPLIEWEGTPREIYGEYRKLLNQVSKNFCAQGEDHKYNKLLERFRGEGHYVPEHPEGEIDTKTIRSYLPELEAKLKWIGERKKELAKRKRLPRYGKLTQGLRRALETAVEAKKAHRIAGNEEEKEKASGRSRESLAKLKEEFNSLMKEVPFLLNYRFPVDHFSNRRRFEAAKNAESLKQLSNRIFFLRQIQEDGTFAPGKRRPDTYLRTTLDTVALRIDSQETLITERLRADLEWVLEKMHRFLREGKNGQLKRLTEWEGRTRGAIGFYRELLKKKKKADGLIATKAKATAELKELVYGKQADVYEFMAGRSELMRALYVMDSILFSEIGPLRRGDRPDRRDILQVVINRRSHPDYARIDESDTIHPLLVKKKSLTPEKIASYKWLNVHYKEGEFSFTYYFIPSVVSTFCPDRSRRAWRIRRTNINIALEMLRSPNPQFDGLRYFSRQSMTGRIDMSPIWTDYIAVPQRPGMPVKNQDALRHAIKNGKYRYLYRFRDPAGKWFDVVEIHERAYSLSEPGLDNPGSEKAVFHHHRDPDKFTYFRPGPGYSTAWRDYGD